MKIVSLLFAAALAPALFAAAPTLKPGQYEVVAEMSMTGPPVRMPAQKLLHCYTPQELEDLAATIAGRSATEKCKVLSSKLTGSTLTFATACAYADGSTLTTSGEVTFTSQESYRAVVNLKQRGERAMDSILDVSTSVSTPKRIVEYAK